MQEEVTQKTMAFSIKSAKLTIQVLQAAARKFLETQNKGKTKLHHGQQSLKQLKKHGAALSNIEITDANIYISPDLEEQVLSESSSGSVAVQLQVGANYIGITGTDYSGTIQITVE